MLDSFKAHLENRFPFLKQGKVLVAISGGIDSVVLTQLCHTLGLNITLAHCNFNLRGNESDADETFVSQLAEDLDIEVFLQRFDTMKYAEEHKCSVQMAARELRYHWFDELSEQLHFDYILTAHHADDNLETFLINFSRGTGLEGLTGIPEINGKFIRPLLPFSSESIEGYAKSNNIKWREDSSNKSVKYLRNRLRHEVVPILKEINPSLLKSFQTTLNNLNDLSVIVNDTIDAFLSRTAEHINDNELRFKISEFKKLKEARPYIYEVFKPFGFKEWDDVLHLLDAQTGKFVQSKTHRLIKDRDFLLLSRVQENEFDDILIKQTERQKKTPFGLILFDNVQVVEKENKNEIYIDKDKIEFPLTIRKKEEGDIFYPKGMTGKKKLSKYFKDEKMSLLDKENVWLLCSSDDVIWVINKRADNRFKVTKTTKHILKITCVSK